MAAKEQNMNEIEWAYCAECAGSGENAYGNRCESCGGLGEVPMEPEEKEEQA